MTLLIALRGETNSSLPSTCPDEPLAGARSCEHRARTMGATFQGASVSYIIHVDAVVARTLSEPPVQEG